MGDSILRIISDLLQNFNVEKFHEEVDSEVHTVSEIMQILAEENFLDELENVTGPVSAFFVASMNTCITGMILEN